MTEYGKLIRDKIPEIIQKDGKTVTKYITTDEEYWVALCDKLREEAEEFARNSSQEECTSLIGRDERDSRI